MDNKRKRSVFGKGREFWVRKNHSNKPNVCVWVRLLISFNEKGNKDKLNRSLCEGSPHGYV